MFNKIISMFTLYKKLHNWKRNLEGFTNEKATGNNLQETNILILSTSSKITNGYKIHCLLDAGQT